MTRILKPIFGAFFIATMAVSGMALAAGSLSAKQVESFVGTLAPVNALGTEMKAEGKQDALAETASTAAFSDEGFKPYSSAIAAMKKDFAGDYGKLDGIVKKQGFASAEEWAGVGDAVMLSFITLKTEQSNPNYAEQFNQMTPQLMANLPPEAKAQIEKSKKMVTAMKAVPAEDKAAVTPFLAQIEEGIMPRKADEATPAKP